MKVYPKRKKWSHKGQFGKLLVIGGSKKYTGSTALVGLAAYRTGIDLVTIAAPERAANIDAKISPDLITVPLKGDYLTKKHLKDLLELTQDVDAITIGNGAGREKATFDLVCKFLEKINKPVVIDADAIRAVAKKKKILNKNFILTPHANEFYALSGKKVKDNVKDRSEIVKKVASELKTIILLKGNVDVISDGKKVKLNKTGNVYMTVGGSGDVLTGICGALLARNIKPFEAAYLSAKICGKAGDLAAKKLKEGLMASDIIDTIPYVIK